MEFPPPLSWESEWNNNECEMRKSTIKSKQNKIFNAMQLLPPRIKIFMISRFPPPPCFLFGLSRFFGRGCSSPPSHFKNDATCTCTCLQFLKMIFFVSTFLFSKYLAATYVVASSINSCTYLVKAKFDLLQTDFMCNDNLFTQKDLSS